MVDIPIKGVGGCEIQWFAGDAPPSAGASASGLGAQSGKGDHIGEGGEGGSPGSATPPAGAPPTGKANLSAGPTADSLWEPTRPTPIDRVSPFEHEFALIAAPARIWYRARYVDIHLRPGVWSGPADATVSP